MLATATTEEDKTIIKELITDLVRKNVRCAAQEDSILHLCVSKLNTIRSSYFMDEEPIVSPKIEVWIVLSVNHGKF